MVGYRNIHESMNNVHNAKRDPFEFEQIEM